MKFFRMILWSALLVTTVQQNALAASNHEKYPASQLIYVSTDVLSCAIDLTGGDLVRAELKQYKDKTPEKSIQLLSDHPESYYVAQSGLAENASDRSEPLRYTSEKEHYALMDNQDSIVVELKWMNPGETVAIRKQFVFRRNDHVVRVRHVIANRGFSVWKGQWYAQLQRKKPMPAKGSYVGGVISSHKQAYEKIPFEKMHTNPRPDLKTSQGWIAMVQHYFISAWIPEKPCEMRFYSDVKNDLYTLGMSGPLMEIGPGDMLKTSAKIYLGPTVIESLKQTAPKLELVVDYGMFWPIAHGLLWLLKHVYQLVGNWVRDIVGVTVLIKLVFYPLSAKSYQSMAALRQLHPQLQAIKARHGQDQQKAAQETIELYRREKINPFGGCLPVLIQIPVFIALYSTLLGSVELRHAPFVLWIVDLSSKDPYYVLPCLMGLTMLIQQKLNPPAGDPLQEKVMMGLPILFTTIFLNFPAGLVLYWLVNNSLSILQQWFVMRPRNV